ncbi:MAG: hypothetical protein LBV50_10600 [Novosphingobium sp.]|jgi:hypothetical protein|nr:hypothetical protein [Novosphingobium sp.]
MAAVLLTTFFIASGLLAATAIGMSWRRYGTASRAIPAELARCGEWREVQVRISEVQIRPAATVLRPAFRAAALRHADRPARQAALPAAA